MTLPAVMPYCYCLLSFDTPPVGFHQGDFLRGWDPGLPHGTTASGPRRKHDGKTTLSAYHCQVEAILLFHHDHIIAQQLLPGIKKAHILSKTTDNGYLVYHKYSTIVPGIYVRKGD